MSESKIASNNFTGFTGFEISLSPFQRTRTKEVEEGVSWIVTQRAHPFSKGDNCLPTVSDKWSLSTTAFPLVVYMHVNNW